MQYQLLGVRSGISAHILSTLLESWRKMLRDAALLGGLSVIATEIIGFTVVHQFPPSLPTNAVALGLGVAVAYGAAATVFIQELFRGAIRAITMLQGEAEGAVGAVVTAFPASMPSVTATPQPIHETLQEPLHGPMRASQPIATAGRLAGQPLSFEEERPVVHALPVASAAVDAPSMRSQPPMPSLLPIPDAAAAMWANAAEHEAHRFVEDEPTRPVGASPDAGATVMVPDNSMYVPRLVPRTQPSRARPSSPVAPFARPAAQDDGAHPLPAATGAPHLPPLAEASPSPGLYAPWSAVPPIADPTAKTELSTMAAREAALIFQSLRRPNWWPRRRVRPLPVES